MRIERVQGGGGNGAGGACCCCSPMSGPVEGVTTKKTRSPEDGKYYRQVGAEMAGNQLIISIEKDKNSKKSRKNWEPPCDCDIIEIKRPKNGKEKPKIVNGGDNNQILFRIHSKAHMNKKDDQNYRPQAIAYQINKPGTDGDNHCKKITVFPQFGGPISQEVYTDHISKKKEDVYLLRVKKKDECPDKRNLEVELHTPKLKKPKPKLPKVKKESEKPPPPDLTKMSPMERCMYLMKQKSLASIHSGMGIKPTETKEARRARCRAKYQQLTRSQELEKQYEDQNKGRCCGNNR